MSEVATDRARSLAWIQLGFAAAIGAALAAGAVVAGRGVESPILIVLAAEIAATLVLFVGSRLSRNSGFNDPHWSLSPPLIALYFAIVPGAEQASLVRQMVVVSLVFAWGARLTYNWMRGFPGFAHEDWRYAKLREEWGGRYWRIELGGIHFFSVLQTFLGCLALYPALVVGTRPLGWLDGVALAVTALAIWIEARADRQLHDFVSRPGTSGAILRDGLWALSRHPNYFGEILFWWGLYLFGLAADPSWWWTIVGPLAITGMFVFVSLPLIEERNLERRSGYGHHVERVSGLIPWFMKG